MNHSRNDAKCGKANIRYTNPIRQSIGNPCRDILIGLFTNDTRYESRVIPPLDPLNLKANFNIARGTPQLDQHTRKECETGTRDRRTRFSRYIRDQWNRNTTFHKHDLGGFSLAKRWLLLLFTPPSLNSWRYPCPTRGPPT